MTRIRDVGAVLTSGKLPATGWWGVGSAILGGALLLARTHRIRHGALYGAALLFAGVLGVWHAAYTLMAGGSPRVGEAAAPVRPEEAASSARRAPHHACDVVKDTDGVAV